MKDLITMTREELSQMLTAAEIRGAAIALDQSLTHCFENDLRRLRDMKTEMKTAQIQLEAQNAIRH